MVQQRKKKKKKEKKEKENGTEKEGEKQILGPPSL